MTNTFTPVTKHRALAIHFFDYQLITNKNLTNYYRTMDGGDTHPRDGVDLPTKERKMANIIKEKKLK